MNPFHAQLLAALQLQQHAFLVTLHAGVLHGVAREALVGRVIALADMAAAVLEPGEGGT